MQFKGVASTNAWNVCLITT